MPESDPQGEEDRPTHLAQADDDEQEAHDADLDPGPHVADVARRAVRVVEREEARALVDAGRVLDGADDDEGEREEERGADEEAVDAQAGSEGAASALGGDRWS